MDKVTRQCRTTTIFEEKGEPKRYRTEVLPLTSPTPYRWAAGPHRLTIVSLLNLLLLLAPSPHERRRVLQAVRLPFTGVTYKHGA